MIGTGLALKDNDLQSIAKAHTNDKIRLIDVLEKRVQMDGQASSVTWHTVIKVIQGLLVENNDVAKNIFQSLKERKEKTTNGKFI